MSFGHSPARHLQETKSHKTFSWNKGKSILFHTISPSHYIWLSSSLFLKSCSSYLELSSSTYSYLQIFNDTSFNYKSHFLDFLLKSRNILALALYDTNI